ncbi:MAG: hypothetical protein IPN71_06610 [Fibrobacteres bacterium]|nr:hypothetical protein [Fibrobacterota bacterium]
MKVGTVALIALAISGMNVAWADCDDTLFLQKIVVYQQSLKNETSLKSWDVSEVNPWDANDVLNAGPVGYSYIDGGPDTLKHLLRFQYNCGADSVSSVEYVKLIDSLRAKGEGFLRVRYAEKSLEMKRSTFNNGGGQGVSLPYNGTALSFSALWEIGEERVGRLKDSAVRESWGFDLKSMSYFTDTNGMAISTQGNYKLLREAKVITMDDLSDNLNDIQTRVAKIGAGVDSVRTTIRLYKYIYDEARPVASISWRGGISPEFVSWKNGKVTVSLNSPMQTTILSPSGRVVRRLDAARNVVWDLRDQAGVRVQPGVWFVQVQGLKTVPVVVR